MTDDDRAEAAAVKALGGEVAKLLGEMTPDQRSAFVRAGCAAVRSRGAAHAPAASMRAGR